MRTVAVIGDRTWFKHAGMLCFISKAPWPRRTLPDGKEEEAYNGYVLLLPGHPLFASARVEIEPFDVHGGITFSRQHGAAWLLGFDTLHYHSAGWTKDMTTMET